MGKLDRKTVFSPRCEDETTTYYDSSLWNSKWIDPNTPAMDSANEKLEKKAMFSRAGGGTYLLRFPQFAAVMFSPYEWRYPLPLPMTEPLPKAA